MYPAANALQTAEGVRRVLLRRKPWNAGYRTSTRLCEIEENDDRRIADWGVMAGEAEAPGLAIHPEDGDVVASLIAAIEELARGVEVEAARIIPACPFFPKERKVAVGADGKDPDAVVQPVTRIDKSPIG